MVRGRAKTKGTASRSSAFQVTNPRVHVPFAWQTRTVWEARAVAQRILHTGNITNRLQLPKYWFLLQY